MDSKILTAVKTLAVALMGEGASVTDETIAAALENLAENYVRPAELTAIELTVSATGDLTGGVATLSDDSTITITVTTET